LHTRALIFISNPRPCVKSSRLHSSNVTAPESVLRARIRVSWNVAEWWIRAYYSNLQRARFQNHYKIKLLVASHHNAGNLPV